MPACPTCHIFKGLWSDLKLADDGTYVCGIDRTHRFNRDKDGNFHSVS